MTDQAIAYDQPIQVHISPWVQKHYSIQSYGSMKVILLLGLNNVNGFFSCSYFCVPLPTLSHHANRDVRCQQPAGQALERRKRPSKVLTNHNNCLKIPLASDKLSTPSIDDVICFDRLQVDAQRSSHETDSCKILVLTLSLHLLSNDPWTIAQHIRLEPGLYSPNTTMCSLSNW